MELRNSAKLATLCDFIFGSRICTTPRSSVNSTPNVFSSSILARRAITDVQKVRIRIEFVSAPGSGRQS
jgi:hypothetical protein